MEANMKINGNSMNTRGIAVLMTITTLFISQNILSENHFDIETKNISIENTAYYLSVSDTFMAYNNLEDCIWALNKAAKCDPSNAEVFHKRGMIYLRFGNFKKAINDLNAAINLGMICADIYNDLGIAYYYNDKLEDAEIAYNKSIDLNQDCAKAYYNRGILRLSTDDVFNATIDFQRAMEINSNLTIENAKAGNVIACILK